MKFPEGWQVDVVRPDGAAAYAGLTHGTVCYIVGVPDQPFEVRVTAPQHVFRTSPTLQVFLKVEGVSPNICNTLYATFRGFVNTVKGQHVINQFLFGAAQTDSEAPALAPGATKVGGLNVSINEVRELPGVHEPLRHVASQTAGGFKAVEGKKWFMQPSLSAQAGPVIGPPVTYSNKRHQTVRQLADLNMRMETAAILVLRKVLDPEDPAHQAIIDRSQPPDEQEEGQGESAESPAAAAAPSNPMGTGLSPRGTKRRVKEEKLHSNKAIKPEPSQTARNRNSGGQSAVIDLTSL